MNRVDAAVIRDLRKAAAAFQARTLEMLMITQPYERPPMADISKCPGDGCDIRDTCKRFTAPSSTPWQSYLAPAYAPLFGCENHLLAEGPMSEANRNNPIPSNMQDTPTKGQP